jgi:hypothetical protein
MGGKSSSAPAPDPRLVEAQIDSMRRQNDMLDRVVANSESMLPAQREQAAFALDAAREGVENARADREWMLTRRTMLSGVQDRLVRDADAFDAAQRGDALAQQATADAESAIARARDSSARDLARRGISPFSGASRSADARLQLGSAAITAGAANTARRAARQEGYALTDRAANALAGYPALSSAATTQGASLAASGVSVANAGAAGMNAGFATAADVAGRVGANATGMFNAQASYKNQQDQIAASSDPFNTILGAVAGAGTSWALGRSDRRLKTDIVVAGHDDELGLTVYHFTYKNLPGRRFEGFMADEVEARYPDAVTQDNLGYSRVDYGRLGRLMREV